MTTGTLIGYARVSTDAQDLTAQRDALSTLGVPQERIYSDRGMTGTYRERPGSERLWRPAGKATPWS
jgi:DNA invertase Pin-like site-specific DNA recombinase